MNGGHAGICINKGEEIMGKDSEREREREREREVWGGREREREGGEERERGGGWGGG